MHIYIYKDEQQLGPFEDAVIREKLSNGELIPSDLAWTEGQIHWEPLDRFLEWEDARAANKNVTENPLVPFATTSCNSNEPVPKDIVYINPESSGDNSPIVEETLFSEIGRLGNIAYRETKRNLQLATLKARIEKLKHLDLPRMHSALGRRAYEMKLDSEQLRRGYSEIAELEKTTSTKRAGVITSDDASEIEKLKQVAKSAKMAVEAELLELKLKRHFVELGRKVENLEPAMALTLEHEALQSIRNRIEKLETAYANITGDAAARREMVIHFGKVAKNVRLRFRELGVFVCNSVISGMSRKRLIIIATSIFCGITVGIVYLFSQKSLTGLIDRGVSSRSSITRQNEAYPTSSKHASTPAVSRKNHLQPPWESSDTKVIARKVERMEGSSTKAYQQLYHRYTLAFVAPDTLGIRYTIAFNEDWVRRITNLAYDPDADGIIGAGTNADARKFLELHNTFRQVAKNDYATQGGDKAFIVFKHADVPSILNNFSQFEKIKSNSISRQFDFRDVQGQKVSYVAPDNLLFGSWLMTESDIGSCKELLDQIKSIDSEATK